jgi:ACS family hexuronate transporter-like MFS transporter
VAEVTNSVPAGATRKIRSLRWYVCGILFLAILINYVDRQTFSILVPDLQRRFGWSELDYGRMVMAFQFGYAVMMMVWGRILDKIGTKIGLTAAFIWWSLAELAHIFAQSALGFGIARFFLGAGEAACFPASLKTVGEWFARSERALANGIVNGAVTVGAVAAPILVPLIAAAYGWKGAFVGTGALGLGWLVLWWALYDKPAAHARLTAEEYEVISEAGVIRESDAPVRWRDLLRYRQLWAHAIARIATEPVYWFFLYWLPKFLAQAFGIRGTAVVPFLTTVYLLTGFGSVGGGYLSSTLIKRGWTVNWARKTAMGASAAVMPFIIFAARTREPWVAVILIGIALAAHQGWHTNTGTLVLDMFPSRAVASVYGIGGLLAGIGSIVAAELTGRVLEHDPSLYLPMFIIAGTVYFLALLAVHLLVPKLQPIDQEYVN